MSSAAAPPRIPFRRKLLYALVVLVVFLLALEGGFRLLEGPLKVKPGQLQRVRAFALREEGQRFLPDAYTAYRLNPAQPGVNSLGFRDEEFLAAPPGTLRVACLGGSTTYGHGVPEGAQSYPAQLERVLEERLGRPVEVQNWGVPNWTSAESMVNYFLNVQDFRPDLVLVQHAMNDVNPRLLEGFRSDYSHYRGVAPRNTAGFWHGLLIQHSDLYAYVLFRWLRERRVVDNEFTRQAAGVRGAALVPETAAPFRRNLRTIADHVRAAGGTPVLLTMAMRPTIEAWRQKMEGATEHNQVIRELAAGQGYLLLDMAAEWPPEDASLEPLFVDPVHLNRAGCRKKAEWVADRLQAAGALD